MQIEKIKLLRTLKAGKKVWLEGEIISAPLPPDLLEEIHRGSEHIEILESQDLPVNEVVQSVVFKPEFKDKIGNDVVTTTTTTTTAKVETPQPKKKSRLVKRS